MAKSHSVAIIALLAIIAAVLLFGADAVKDASPTLAIATAIFVPIGGIVWVVWKIFAGQISNLKWRKERGWPWLSEAFGLVFFALTLFILIASTLIWYFEGIPFFSAMEKLNAVAYIGLTIMAMGYVINIFERRQELSEQFVSGIKKWGSLIIGPYLVIRDQFRDAEHHEEDKQALQRANDWAAFIGNLFLAICLSVITIGATLAVLALIAIQIKTYPKPFWR